MRATVSILVLAVLCAGACGPRRDPAPNDNSMVSGTKPTGPKSPGKPGAVELTPGECNDLGGTIVYDTQCTDYHLTCKVQHPTGSSSSCIDELDPGTGTGSGNGTGPQ